jgi:hypothetical protein
MKEAMASAPASARRSSARPRVLPWGALIAAAAWGCAPDDLEPAERTSTSIAEAEIVPRTPYLETYSCLVQCHNDLELNPVERPLTEFHTLRAVRHGPAIRWCSSCHDLFDLDRLRLFDASHVTFDESYRLCAQCHGEQHRDWQAGIHGLQTGEWGGPQARRSCTFCHDPHVPGLPRVVAMPAPENVAQRWEWP